MQDKSTISQILDYIYTLGTGAVISIMVVFNTELGLHSTNEVSIAINQAVGIIALSLIMWLGRGSAKINPKREKSDWWQWFGGLFGLGVITSNYYSVSRAGTTIAMAAAVLGQCIMGIIFDLTGWMGMKKRSISKRKALSLVLSLIGILIMLLSQNGDSSLRTIIFGSLGIVAGILTMVQMVCNSGFAKRKGPFFSARQNVISGLCGIALFMVIFKLEPSIEGFRAAITAPWYILFGGGVLACVVVISTNIIIPRIPGAVSAILLSIGQILMAVLLDYLMSGIFAPSLFIGSLVMLLGILLGG